MQCSCILTYAMLPHVGQHCTINKLWIKLCNVTPRCIIYIPASCYDNRIIFFSLFVNWGTCAMSVSLFVAPPPPPNNTRVRIILTYCHIRLTIKVARYCVYDLMNISILESNRILHLKTSEQYTVCTILPSLQRQCQYQSSHSHVFSSLFCAC